MVVVVKAADCERAKQYLGVEEQGKPNEVKGVDKESARQK